MKIPVSIEKFPNHYGVKSNFLEYNNICHKIRKFLEWKDTPLYSETLPRNSTLDILLDMSTKGCSKLYTMVKNSNEVVLNNLVNQWNETS